MLTKSIYCGDNWEFQITQDDTGVSLDLKSKSHNIQKWEIEELRDFINQYLGQTETRRKTQQGNIL